MEIESGLHEAEGLAATNNPEILQSKNPATIVTMTQLTASEILRARAHALAREAGSQQAGVAALEVIEFGLAHERYALEAAFVSEVHPLENLTPLPGTPPFVAGIVNVRGRLLPVMDIKKFFDLPEQGITDTHQILLVRAEEMELGILADTVAGVRSIPLDVIQASLPTLTGIREEYLKGVTADRLVILDVARILADRRILVHEEVEG
jgi:purine-binding chemotaxis protein CheW